LTWPFNAIPRVGENILISSLDDIDDIESIKSLVKCMTTSTYTKEMLYVNLQPDCDSEEIEELSGDELKEHLLHEQYSASYFLYNDTMKFISDHNIEIENGIYEITDEQIKEFNKRSIFAHFLIFSNYLIITKISWDIYDKTVEVTLDLDPAKARFLTEEEKENLETYIHKI